VVKQLGQILLLVYVRKEYVSRITNLEVGAVSTGAAAGMVGTY